MTNNSSSLVLPFSVKAFHATITAWLLIIGIPANLLLLFVLCRYPTMHSTTNLYLSNLAIADLLHLPQLIFLITTIQMEKFIFGPILCKFYLTFEAANSFAVTFILTATSFDRYLAICRPLDSQKLRSPFVARLSILFIWIFSLALLSPLSIYAKLVITPIHLNSSLTNESINHCVIDFPDILQSLYTIYSFLCGFVLPVLTICLFYWLVVRKLRRRQRDTNSQRIVRMIVTLITVYIILWLPYWLHQALLHITYFDVITNIYIGLFTQFLLYLNSTINPFLYTLFSQNFRKIVFNQILGCPGHYDEFEVRQTSAYPLTTQGFIIKNQNNHNPDRNNNDNADGPLKVQGQIQDKNNDSEIKT